MFADRNQSKAVHDHFDDLADDWQSIYSGSDLNALNIQLRQACVLDLVDRLGLPDGAHVLDLGCGAGLTCVELLKRGFEIAGRDVAESMVALAKQRCETAGAGSRADIAVGNAEELEFEDGVFDLVIAMGLIEYLRWDRWTLQQIHHFLKPGGYLIVTVPNEVRLSFLLSKPWQRMVAIKRILSASGRRLRRKDSRETSISSEGFERRLYWPGRLDRMLEDLGFDVLTGASHGFGPFPILERSPRASLHAHSFLQGLTDSGWVPFLRRLGNNYNVLCQKAENSSHGGNGWFFATFERRMDEFRSKYRKQFASRDRWTKEHPELAESKPRPIEALLDGPETVLVLSPHPDDELIGCGGTLLKLSEREAKITILQVTDGSASAALQDEPEDERRSVRLTEADAVASALGAELIVWGRPDGNLQCDSDNVEKLLAVLDRQSPTMIFVPFVNDPHPDHLAANRILAAALDRLDDGLDRIKILSYEVWSFVPANIVVDVDAHFDEKVRLLFKYITGMKAADYVAFCRSLGAWHAAHSDDRKGFAEGFLALDAAQYVRAVRG